MTWAVVAATASLLLFGRTGEAQQSSGAAQKFDLILRNGTVLDGTGAKRFKADVGIIDGQIAAVGDLSGSTGSVDLNVNGLFVAPGFINLHSHAVPSALPTAENMLTQGVTTEILNPDGGGSTNITEQLSQDSTNGLAVNIGAYIGFNSVWQSVMGTENKRATDDDIARMRALVTDNLKRGAWGVSAGLDYKPAYFALTDEVVKVVSVAGPWRTNFPNHERLTPETGYSSRVGIAETITIGERAGLVPVITHMKVQGHEQGTATSIVALMQQATASGHYTAADVYPYLAGQTGLAALLVPGWAQEGGRDAMLQRFKDPVLRARIIKESEEAMNARFGGAKGVYLPATQQEFADIVRDLDVSPGEALVQILEKSSPSAILRFGAESDLVTLLQNPTASIACDCGASTATRTHPRYYGTFPRVLGHYVRETKALTWEDAVRKMSGLSASTIGMTDRGFVAPGMAADVTVFDSSTVIDHATYESPAQFSDGIRYVIVNGHIALRDGKITGEKGGAVLTRSPHMPSRPMSSAYARSVVDNGVVDNAGSGSKTAIALDMSQGAYGRRATGSFHLEDPATRTVINMTAPGLLQVGDKWAAFTGRAKTSGEERSINVIIDQADPLAAGHSATITVDAEGGYHFSGTLNPDAAKISISR